MTFQEFAALMEDRVQIADLMSMGSQVSGIVRRLMPPGIEIVATTTGLFEAMKTASGGLTTEFLGALESLLVIGNPMVLAVVIIDPIEADAQPDLRQDPRWTPPSTDTPLVQVEEWHRLGSPAEAEGVLTQHLDRTRGAVHAEGDVHWQIQFFSQ